VEPKAFRAQKGCIFYKDSRDHFDGFSVRETVETSDAFAGRRQLLTITRVRVLLTTLCSALIFGQTVFLAALPG